jgi:hypothetical protein
VVKTTRTPNKIYILNEIEDEICCLGKEDESWLQHRIMVHIHFDNVFKISKKKVVRDMPEITNPTNIMCKHCRHGKQTKFELKTKEYSTTKQLDIIHTYICGPTRTKGLDHEQYFMLLIDDYTKMTGVFFLKKKVRRF